MKKLSKIGLLIILILSMTLVLFGCGAPSAPTNVRAVGSVLLWDPVDKADGYELHTDSGPFMTVDADAAGAYVGELSNSSEFTVKARKGNSVSRHSQGVVVSKNTGFIALETMTVELRSNMEYTVPSTINRLVLTMSGGVDVARNTTVLISDRISSLFIELNNVQMESRQNKACIMTYDGVYSQAEKSFCVTINIIGTSSLTGANNTAVPGTPRNNSGTTGTTGFGGNSAIILPAVAFVGSGNLILNGGKGGRGGTGAASSGFTYAIYGNGGNGGVGGNGIQSTHTVVAMNISGMLRINGGTGGDGGQAGSNGSILTGPAMTAQWSNRHGSRGRDGQAVIGELTRISGMFLSN